MLVIYEVRYFERYLTFLWGLWFGCLTFLL